MPKPRVTLGLPVYNGERYVGQAIESALHQTFADFVLVIADNCSSDGTEAICRRHAATDARIVYHRHDRNIGAGPNFDFLFQGCETEYFKWCPHDDAMAPDYLGRCVAALDADADAVLCHTDTLIIDAAGAVVARSPALPKGPASPSPVERFSGFILQSRVCHEVLGLMRTAALRHTRLHQAYFGSDRALLAEMMLQGRFLAVAEPLFMNRRHAEAFSESATQGAKVVAAWYNPERAPRRPSVASRLYRDYWRMVWGARLGFAQKLGCSGALLLWPLLPGHAMEFIREGMQYLPDPVARNLRRGKRLIIGR